MNAPVTATMPLRLQSIRLAARNINLYEFAPLDAAALPTFKAGAHIDLHLPNGLVRQYSLCNAPGERHRYVVAVKRDAQSRGGSQFIHESLRVGDVLAVGAPRNNFELHPRAGNFLFIAGGIGITPILSMVRHLSTRRHGGFRLIYCTRDADHTAFLQELTGPRFAGQVQLHHDHGDIASAFDFWPVFEKPETSGATHVYCCGPRGLMDAVADMSGHWPSGSIHFESFGADASAYLAKDGNPFLALAFDPQGRAAIDWGVTAPPETFIIGGDGTVLFRFVGPLVGSYYEQAFVPALRAALAK